MWLMIILLRELPVVQMVVVAQCWREIGLVGKAIGRYNLHIGGDREGVRIPRLYKRKYHDSGIIAELDTLIGRWANERHANEGFGDFTIRAGIIKPVVKCTG